MIHPRLPPSLSAKTPDVPPQKKCGTMPGIISAMPSPPSKSIPTSPPTKELMNPTTTAVGLKVKNTAQSTAGMESGISFWLMPSERRHQIAEDQPHAVIDNGYANGELQTGQHREDQHVLVGDGAQVRRPGDSAADKVDNKHHDTGGDRGIAQKAPLF